MVAAVKFWAAESRTLREPYTLHPNPYTLNPQPFTLHLKPCTLNPKPQTLNPKPFTPNPKPQTSKQGGEAGGLRGSSSTLGVEEEEGALRLSAFAHVKSCFSVSSFVV